MRFWPHRVESGISLAEKRPTLWVKPLDGSLANRDSAVSVKDVEAYLAKLSADKRATLERVRKAIRAAAPNAAEGMSYGMPAFIQGKPVAAYAAGASQCGYYPMSDAITKALASELARYETSKGAIRFPVGKPPPAALIRKLVKARLAEIAIDSKPAEPKKSSRVTIARFDPEVTAYLRRLDHPLKKEIEAVRRTILGASPRIGEGVKWNAPSFRTEKDYFATFNMRANRGLEIIFHRGAKSLDNDKAMKVVDRKGLLKWLATDRAVLRLGQGKDIAANQKALEQIVRAWIGQA